MRVEVKGSLNNTAEARWEAGRKAAERFEQVPEAHVWLLGWLWPNVQHLPDMKCVEYVVSVMERFPQHKKVQQRGCYVLYHFCYSHPALREPAGEVGAVGAVVHALDRFAASRQHFRNLCVGALRLLTNGLPLNAARLEAAGGTHYLQ